MDLLDKILYSDMPYADTYEAFVSQNRITATVLCYNGNVEVVVLEAV